MISISDLKKKKFKAQLRISSEGHVKVLRKECWWSVFIVRKLIEIFNIRRVKRFFKQILPRLHAYNKNLIIYSES